ncbi:radical SAM protein [Tissierella pigra]|uniref:Radical SAM protein n=1 Tax=Tissierella pigra TaxID=2607614 RepID=A0A6N7XJ14_9FIRM|nr:radical SAM protein [Tissierella pigra]MBU5425826.1 radical SAM protein [Tissierella pigra]MSU01596.1 radical SAM protein [Tissierella pigra]
MKPFIHLFKTPKNYYFYDVNKNENVRIEHSLYQYLNNMMSGSNKIDINNELEDKLKDLKEGGYLSDNRVKEIKHPTTDSLGLYLERQTDMLILQLTQSCNLRCSYCNYTSNNGTERVHNSANKMSWDLAKQSIDYYIEKSVDSQQITINFYGGEPLLEFELLKKCVDYVNQVFKGKGRNFHMTTNATLLDDEKARYLNDNNFNLVISLDGTKTINDRNRKFANGKGSVFESVITNIENISKYYQNLFSNLCINMVLDPSATFENYIKVFDEFEFLKSVRVMSSIVDDSSLVNKNQVSLEFIESYDYYSFLSYLHMLGRVNLKDKFYLLSNYLMQCTEVLEGLTNSVRLGKVYAPSGPCLPGKQRLMVNAEGKMLPCERVSEIIEKNHLGNIQNGIDLERALRILNVAKSNEDTCKNCFAFRHCSLCAKAYECASISKDILKESCNRCRDSFHDKLVDMEILNEIRYDNLL